VTGVFIHLQLHSSDQDQQTSGLLVTGEQRSKSGRGAVGGGK